MGTFEDASFAAQKNRKPQTKVVLHLTICTVGCFSRKQKTVNTSMTEAKYIDLSSAVKEVRWAQQLIGKMAYKVSYPTGYDLGDNQPAISLATNSRNPTLAKHVDVKWHAVQDNIQRGYADVAALTKVRTNDSIPDRLLGNLGVADSQESEGVCESMTLVYSHH